MAFLNRVSGVLRQAASKQMNMELPASSTSLFQAIRSMSSSKLFVGGLSYGTDEMSLREAFSQHGEVIEARIIMDRETGRSRGFGFITYTSSEEASSAIGALDGQELHGRRIKVNHATERARGGGFRGDFGGEGGGYGGYGSGGRGYGGSGGYGEGGGYGSGDRGYGGSGGYGEDARGYGSGGGYGNTSTYGGTPGGEYGNNNFGLQPNHNNYGSSSNYGNASTYGGTPGGEYGNNNFGLQPNHNNNYGSSSNYDNGTSGLSGTYDKDADVDYNSGVGFEGGSVPDQGESGDGQTVAGNQN